MTDDRIVLCQLVEKSADADLLRAMIGFAAERPMELEVQALTGAAYGERSPDRRAQRHGYRERIWETRAGSVELDLSSSGKAATSRAAWNPRRVAEKALVKALGMAGISKSQVSRLCTEIDERVRTFLERPIEGLPGRVGERGPNPAPTGQWPYLWIDATYVKAREAGRRRREAGHILTSAP